MAKKKEKWKLNESTWINLRHKNYGLEIVSLNNSYIKEHKKRHLVATKVSLNLNGTY